MKWSNSSRNAKNFFLNFFFYFDGLPQVINQIFHFQPIDIGSHMRNLAFKWGFCFCLDPHYSTFPRSFSRPTEQVNCTLSISALKYLLLYLLKYMCIFWNMFMQIWWWDACLRGKGVEDLVRLASIVFLATASLAWSRTEILDMITRWYLTNLFS